MDKQTIVWKLLQDGKPDYSGVFYARSSSWNIFTCVYDCMRDVWFLCDLESVKYEIIYNGVIWYAEK